MFEIVCAARKEHFHSTYYTPPLLINKMNALPCELTEDSRRRVNRTHSNLSLLQSPGSTSRLAPNALQQFISLNKTVKWRRMALQHHLLIDIKSENNEVIWLRLSKEMC